MSWKGPEVVRSNGDSTCTLQVERGSFPKGVPGRCLASEPCCCRQRALRASSESLRRNSRQPMVVVSRPWCAPRLVGETCPATYDGGCPSAHRQIGPRL